MTEHGGQPQQPEQQPDPYGRQPYQPGQPPYQGEPQPGPPYPGQPQPFPGQPPQFPGQTQPFPGQPQPYPGPPFAQGEQPYPPGPPQGQPPYPPGQPMPLGQPFPPPAAKKKGGIKALAIGGVTVVVLIAGCCIGGNLLLGDKDDDKKASGGGGDKPVSAAEYATVLSEVDTSLKAPFAALSTGDKAAFGTAATSLRDGSQKLSAIEAPVAASRAQDELTGSMLQLADVVERSGTEKADCPAASPAAAVLASDEAGLVREDAKALATADPALTFGSFLPAAPKEQTRQLKNGTFVKKGPGGGRGVLEIKNGAGDTTVSLVGKDVKKPVFTVYVRGGGNFTVKNIKPGKYEIYTASGEDWDAGKKGFTRKCGFSKFDDKFDYDSSGSGWTITLQEVIGGNASTSDVDPGSFPTD